MEEDGRLKIYQTYTQFNDCLIVKNDRISARVLHWLSHPMLFWQSCCLSLTYLIHLTQSRLIIIRVGTTLTLLESIYSDSKV